MKPNAQRNISLDDFSSAVAAIHAAAAFPERWPEAFSAVARLVSASSGSVRLDAPLQTLLGLGADSGDDADGCSPEVRQVLSLLAPHLKTAREVRTRLAEALPALATLDRLAVAAFVMTAGGTVHHLNASARTLLAQSRWVRVLEARLRFGDAASNAAFEAALRAATRTPARSSTLPMASADHGGFEVTVSPLDDDQVRLSSWSEPRVLVLVTRPWLDARSIVQRVRSAYGLTDAEARVMAALTLGRTVEEVAQEHGVRASTVRAQVRSIFEKTGVNRQTDLVRLGLTGAPLVLGPQADGPGGRLPQSC